jgi:protein involved in polysaccharide export with SLBB domain
VQVREYRSQFVWVSGAVMQPVRTPLRGATRLIDVLLAAGGLGPSASGEVVIERRLGRFADGSTVKTLFLTGETPTPEELRALETRLNPRDVVTARKVRYVQVSGAVARPGRYPLRRGTLAEALDAAGGLTRAARRPLKVNRVDPRTGAPTVLELEPEREPEAPLLSDDEVVVPKRSS